MRTLRPCIVVLLILLSIVSAASAAGAPRSAQLAPAACTTGACTLYLPLLKYDVAPLLLDPAEGAQLATLAPPLTWTPSTIGIHRIQVTTDAGFSPSGSFALSTTKTVRLPLPESLTTALSSNLKYSTTYFWRVGVALPQGGTAYSSVQSFTTPAQGTLQLPGLVPIIAPRNNDNISGARVLLKWGTVPGALIYRIRMSDANGNDFTPGDAQVAGDQTTAWVEDIPKGTYTWKIKVLNSAGWGPYGNDYKFTLR